MSREKTMESITIRPMLAGELEAACNVISLAFADNPNMGAITNGDTAKAQHAMHAIANFAKLGRRYSYVLVAEISGQIAGVLNAAQWPHCQMDAAEQKSTGPAMYQALGTSMPKAMELIGTWVKYDPQKPHWHIGPLGILPAFQGRGIGRALLRAFLEKADQDHVPAYLEAEVDKNVRLYESEGFNVIAQEAIFGLNNRFMWREAKES
ncbi:GNAT family N-acetyltransferase [Edaphobacter albus]|uniref:GNAT family N-acetyltransferase n=1 Tax=Edaphobacter sp. 4G125 TaxID=2763071 RepID=UPI00164474EE|nr:N-acetyltransferase [Edaphobacter sp. 4G125]QNI37222.1 GNAT family N-acetyltransferase [Edaphobacter sp. 4G125]